MKILGRTWMALALILIVAAMAAAQGQGRLDGEVRDSAGNPFPDVTVELKNPDTGQAQTTKTDKNGKFTFIGLRTAIYNVTLTNEKVKLHFMEQTHVQDGEDNTYKVNFKDLAAKAAAEHPEEVKKREEETKNFESLKTHFAAGVSAMNDAKDVKTKLQATPKDSSLKDKLSGDYQTAITEFQAAEKAAAPKDISNHSLIWANMGAAEEGLNQFADAASSFQKAIELKPQPPYYVAAATDLAKSGKFTEATDSCDKGIALDPTIAGMCWKNIGIVLSNGANPKEGVEPLKKAIAADPKDAQAWWLLGNALSAAIDTKQQGEKTIFIIPEGTKEAYQKCIDLNPSGPYAAQAKAALDNLASLDEGVQSTITKRKKKG